ncbi:MAG: N-acetylglucosamine-6-phosphate deacetylase, partial [Acidobacteriota bacterium]|nr:N-acetylglucosamine-6-phosphate deacetylase [Acidobacteriota bacterium]
MTVAARIDAPAELLTGARVVAPDGVHEGVWVQVSGGRIDALSGTRPDSDAAVVDLQGAWLLPGYIDLHVHGGGGHSVSASLRDMEDAVAFHQGHGTTATLVSLVTAPEQALCEQLGWAAELVRRGPTRRG